MKRIRRISIYLSIILFMSIILFLSIICSSSESIITAYANESIENSNDLIEYEEIFSYRTILREYYDLALSNNTISLETTFDEYSTNYLNTKKYSNNNRNSSIADYILNGISNLNNLDPIITPRNEFQRNYEVNDITTYSNLQNGDIILETNNTNFWIGTLLNNAGHTAYITNTQKEYSDGTYIQTIEAVNESGVTFGFLDDIRMIEYGVIILRPIGTNQNIINDATYFMRSQIGKPYSFSITRANTSINSTEWYCSEIINAAYHYAALDFCAINYNGGVLPYDLLHSTFIEYVKYDKYLDIRISKLYGMANGECIEIFNNTGNTITCYYNSKKCFSDDAKNWSNLSDVQSFSLSQGQMTRVNIENNWWADAVAISYINNDVRYITFGNQMRTGSYLMAVYKVKQFI